MVGKEVAVDGVVVDVVAPAHILAGIGSNVVVVAAAAAGVDDMADMADMMDVAAAAVADRMAYRQ